MNKSHRVIKTLASLLFLLTLATISHAQNAGTWVAGNGNDANPCTYASPCRTFAAALALTNAGGEINVKDAGRFGNITINKSITIDGGGTFSGMVKGGGGSAVIVDDSTSPTPNTAVVTLRNLAINGGGTIPGAIGVEFVSGKTLNIENCQVSNFSYAGLRVAAPGGNVNIKNASIFSATSAVLVEIVPGSATVSLNGCNIEQNTVAGVNVLAGGYVSIRDSVIQFNGYGVFLQASGSTANIMGSQVNHNTTGLGLALLTTATVGSSTFLDNVTNFANTGTIKTFGNNQTSTNPIPGAVTNLGLR